MIHRGTVTLETERLVLRRFAKTDAPAMFANWCNDPEVTKYLMWQPHGTLEVTLKTLDEVWLNNYGSPSFYGWAIVLKSIDEPIGSIGVVKHDDNVQMVHIGYCIGKSWWHLGITSEALSRIVRFFFEEVGARRIESRHDLRNINSGRVMQKAGLRYEGTSLQSDWNMQGVCDVASYAILAREYYKNSLPSIPFSPCIRPADAGDLLTVTELLSELFCASFGDLLDENRKLLSDKRQQFFLCFAGEKPIGAAHAALRSDYVNGTIHDCEPCGYLEAVYVREGYRNNHVAAKLVKACEDWAKAHACSEFASDCLLFNTDSYLFHLSLGFAETERCIFFRKDI